MQETTTAGKGEPEYGASEHYLGTKGEEYFAWQRGGGEFAARISEHTFKNLICATDTVIDFGCGGGFLLRQIKCDRRIGIEINPAARKFASAHGTEVFATIEECPDGIADVVISNHALEHVPFPIGALRSLRRKLKPDGLVALCVPIDNWRHQKAYVASDENHHLHTWTPLQLGNSLHEAGFTEIKVSARICAWPGRWTVATYGRLPYWCFRQICFWYGWLTGRGWEAVATARPVVEKELALTG